MKTQLKNIISYLSESYWLIPLLIALIATILALLIVWLDRTLGQNWIHQANWMFFNHPQGARTILATIAGSMITVAGVTFSLTIVAVSFALGQIGPRLIHNFMRDRVSQFTLGIFIATFLYCLLVLRNVIDANEPDLEFVPHIAIFFAILLAITSIIVFIFFIHHIPKSINVYQILAKIGKDLNQQFAHDRSEFIYIHQKEEDFQTRTHQNIPQPLQPIYAQKIGYLRFFDLESLLKIATEKDLVFDIKSRPGEFVTITTPLFLSNKPLDKKDLDHCLNNVAIGDERDEEQDPFYLSDKIVEIIARALSPGIYDPFTAMTAISWLQSSIEILAKRQPPHPYIYDKDHQLRLIVPSLMLSDFVTRIFGQIRPYASKDRNTTFYLMNIFLMMSKQTSNQNLCDLLRNEAENLYESAKINLIQRDQEALKIDLTKIYEAP